MKYLVIPDIHTKWKQAEKFILENSEIDKIILLGDYFDDFDDSVSTNCDTAYWLKNIINKDNVIALFGNHEFNYFKKLSICSGYSKQKYRAINSILTLEDWYKLKTYYYDMDNNIFFCHAGATKPLFVNPITNEFNLEKIKDMYESPDKLYTLDWIRTEIGVSRGGLSNYGSIFWCDFNEDFEPIENLLQIFGHTFVSEPKLNKNSICLDTRLNHCLIIDTNNNELKIIEKDKKIKKVVDKKEKVEYIITMKNKTKKLTISKAKKTYALITVEEQIGDIENYHDLILEVSGKSKLSIDKKVKKAEKEFHSDSKYDKTVKMYYTSSGIYWKFTDVTIFTDCDKLFDQIFNKISIK